MTLKASPLNSRWVGTTYGINAVALLSTLKECPYWLLGDSSESTTGVRTKMRVCQNRARSRFVVPSFWKEGCGVVEKNTVITYYNSIV